jgi:hypothetical protein
MWVGRPFEASEGSPNEAESNRGRPSGRIGDTSWIRDTDALPAPAGARGAAEGEAWRAFVFGFFVVHAARHVRDFCIVFSRQSECNLG